MTVNMDNSLEKLASEEQKQRVGGIVGKGLRFKEVFFVFFFILKGVRCL